MLALSALSDLSVEVNIVHDGPLDISSRWDRYLSNNLARNCKVIVIDTSGNLSSFYKTLDLATQKTPEAAILLAEDDYLWLPSSVSSMMKALRELPGHYVTGYDHPDRYSAFNRFGADLPHYHHQIHIAGRRHWRAVESTCMTFLTTVGSLLEDLTVLKQSHWENARPDSRSFFRAVQQLSGVKDIGRRRLLLAAMPALCTHCQLPYLAHLIDWTSYASRITLP